MVEVIPWEPEETVGKLWHRIAGRLDGGCDFSVARVTLEEMRARVAVMFRGLGGDPSVEIKAVVAEESRHRLGLRRRLAMPAEHVARASYDGEVLRLPADLAEFPERAGNVGLYLWLAAMAAHAPAPAALPEDPLAADLAAISAAQDMVSATLRAAPGLHALWQGLVAAHLAYRPRPVRGGVEADVEASIRHALLGMRGAAAPVGAAPRGYRPFRPVPMWLGPVRGGKSACRRDARGRRRRRRPQGPPPCHRPRRTQGQHHHLQVRGLAVVDAIPQPQPPGRG
jgi:nitric oxide reductase NorD protein